MKRLDFLTEMVSFNPNDYARFGSINSRAEFDGPFAWDDVHEAAEELLGEQPQTDREAIAALRGYVAGLRQAATGSIHPVHNNQHLAEAMTAQVEKMG